MKPSDSPVHDCINENHETLAKEDVDFQEIDYSDDGDFENEDEKHLLDLVPSVTVCYFSFIVAKIIDSCVIQDFKIYLKTLRHIYKCNKRSFFK
jgi:hypothetical protein